MSNHKSPFEGFDGDSLDALVSGPDAPEKIEAYMDSILDHFKESFREKFGIVKQATPPTASLDLGNLVPVRPQAVEPIWNSTEMKTDLKTPPTKAPKAAPIPEYPPIPDVRPKRNRWGMIISSMPEPQGALLDKTPVAKPTQKFSEKPAASTPHQAPVAEDRVPKGKAVNKEAIEKRFKDRQDKLNDLFKNRGQIS